MTRDEETNERNACDEWWHAQPNKGASIQEAWIERARRTEQDAKRYRWLKENAEVIFKESRGFIWGASGRLIFSTMPSVYELDSAIDGIIKEEEQEAAAREQK